MSISEFNRRKAGLAGFLALTQETRPNQDKLADTKPASELEQIHSDPEEAQRWLDYQGHVELPGELSDWNY